ncbi:MAG: type IX secretion system protein PorQ [Marinifilaceae bacterium]
MKRNLAIIFFLLMSSFSSLAQVGGERIYEFLNLPSSARVTALGGEQIATGDAEADLSFHNPSLLSADMDQTISLNYVSYLADINYGYASYTKHFNKWGTWSAGIHYVNYGKFVGADEYGQITGNFKASEYALLISWAMQLSPKINIGASFKPIYSNLEKYNSFGLAMDFGVTYSSTDQLFKAALVAKNAGYQFIPYYGSEREPLPFEILVGMSQKLAHAPFRIAITYRHLQKFDLNYTSPLSISNRTETDQNLSDKKDSFGDKILKHMIMGLEFLPMKNVVLRTGYNFQRRQELKVDSKSSTVGFSWGFGIKISQFHINYSSARYHLAGASNHFSISTRLSDFNFK